MNVHRVRQIGFGLLAILAVVGLGALWLWLRTRGQEYAARRVLADIADAWTEPKIAAAHDKAERLKQQLGAEHAAVARATAEVAAQKDALRARYQTLELTPEEIEIRFRDLRV